MRTLNRFVRFILLASAFLGGCATTPFEEARHQFLRGQPETAIATLDDPGNQSSRDSLLIHMEKGLILHHLGEYERSTKEFLKASELMESRDYISISEQTKTLVINEWMAAYKGEYSERLWVHTWQMMNYLLLGRYDSAAVEARQALKVLDKHPKPLEQDWFTHALIGLSFEAVGKINDAYIEYKKLAGKMPDYAPIAKQLHGYAQRLGFTEETEEYQASVPDHLQGLDPDKYGELILFVANGAIPQKVSSDLFVPPDIRISFPRYNDSFTPSPVFRIHTAEHELPFVAISTHLGDVAQASLDVRGKAILAKVVARVSVKQSLARGLEKNNEAAGQLLSVLFFVLEEADTRGWGTLPANLVMIRIPLPPDIHSLTVTAGESHHALKEIYRINHLSVAPGQRIYRKIRY